MRRSLTVSAGLRFRQFFIFSSKDDAGSHDRELYACLGKFRDVSCDQRKQFHGRHGRSFWRQGRIEFYGG